MQPTSAMTGATAEMRPPSGEELVRPSGGNPPPPRAGGETPPALSSFHDPHVDPYKINYRELLESYNLHGFMGRIRLTFRLAGNLILSALARRAPSPGITAALQRLRGVRIGRHVYIGPRVEIDLLYPHLVTIEDYVSVGMDTIIFAHTNPTCSIELKQRLYPRTTSPVTLKAGSWIMARCIILEGVTVGENAAVGAGSLVHRSVPPATLVGGVPARFLKKLEPKTA